MKVQAQVLYDLRTLTGVISGEELHELFRHLFDGEPSPSGQLEFELTDLWYAPYGREVLAELNRTLRKAMPGMALYILGDPFGDSDKTMEQKLAFYAQKDSVELLFQMQRLNNKPEGRYDHSDEYFTVLMNYTLGSLLTRGEFGTALGLHGEVNFSDFQAVLHVGKTRLTGQRGWNWR